VLLPVQGAVSGEDVRQQVSSYRAYATAIDQIQLKKGLWAMH
jgi:hypothetical protein